MDSKVAADVLLFGMERLIGSPQSWTQGARGAAADGRVVSPHGPMAVSWCLMGAMQTVREMARGSEKWSNGADSLACSELVASIPKEQLPEKGDGWLALTKWNDAPDRTHADVIRAIRKARLRIKGQQ